MRAEFVNGNIRADCPDCGVPTSFEYKLPSGGNEFGTIIIEDPHLYVGLTYLRTFYKLFRCTVCNRPGVAKLHVNNSYLQSSLEWFWPNALKLEKVPSNVPKEILNEFREAELCMSVGAWRAASALLRSALEKVLKVNGFNENSLFEKIEASGNDGVITSARRQKAQDLVRTLGNDVLHEDWREVKQDEVESAHHYVSRILEDLYDDRTTIEKILSSKKRIQAK